MTDTPNKLGITPGSAIATEGLTWGRMVPFVHVGKMDGIRFYNINDAELYAEAHNVANTTGLTPRQLLEQRDELLGACKAAAAHVEDLRDAWQRGILDERDGLGGTRSNRNVDVLAGLNVAINATKDKP